MIRKLKVRIIESACFLKNNNYFTMSIEQIFEMFLPPNFIYEFVRPYYKADICIFSIGLENTNLLRKNEINILISIENCSYWIYYPHYQKYNNFGNEMVDIYLYNHINKLYENNKYIAIPTIYSRINYYNKIKDNYTDKFNCSFNEKKFCLVINRSKINKNICKFVEILKNIGDIDNINLYDKEIKNISCYNSTKLLQIFNKYKFILTVENSYNDGYITEKIFNVFLSKSIPIYSGSKNVENILNSNSFININTELTEDIINKIKNINIDEEKYNEMIKQNKINEKFDDEEYINKMNIYIKNKLNI